MVMLANGASTHEPYLRYRSPCPLHEGVGTLDAPNLLVGCTGVASFDSGKQPKGHRNYLPYVMNCGPRRNTLIAAGAITIILSLTLLIFCIRNGVLHRQWPWPLMILSLFWIIWPVHLTKRRLRKPRRQ